MVWKVRKQLWGVEPLPSESGRQELAWLREALSFSLERARRRELGREKAHPEAYGIQNLSHRLLC